MGRKPRFNKEDFIRAALDLLSEKGLTGVTMTGIANRIEAPIGSVYHRFQSREILLAELWLELIESFQNGFIKTLRQKSKEQAALFTLKWVRQHPNKARVFLLHRREELMNGEWQDSLKKKAEKLTKELEEAITEYTSLLYGNVSKENKARVVFALIHIPSAAVRPYLEKGQKPPQFFDAMIVATCQTILDGCVFSSNVQS